MSVVVDLATLHVQIERFGSRALLVTTGTDGPPHVASVLVTVAGDKLEMGGGRKTRANASERPAVVLVWIARDENEHCLIVDGTGGEGSAGEFIVTPTSAVLHRLAGAPDEVSG